MAKRKRKSGARGKSARAKQQVRRRLLASSATLFAGILLLLLAFGAVVAVRAWPLLFGRGGMRGGFVLSLTIVLVLICCLMESYVGFTEDLINVLFFYACGCVMAIADRRA